MTPHARTADPETSHQAAESVFGMSDLQADLLRLFRQFGPMTDEQLIGRHDDAGMVSRTDSRIRTARHELEEAGKVEWSGGFGLTGGGGKTRIWRIVPKEPTLF